MKTLATFQTRFEAEAVGRTLEAEDIPYFIQANDCSGLMPSNCLLEQVLLVVGDDDFERASALLAGLGS